MSNAVLRGLQTGLLTGVLEANDFGGGSPFFNFRPGDGGNVATLTAAKRAGGRIRAGFIGDSTTMGYNAGGTGYTGAEVLTVSNKMADVLAACGMPTNKDIIFSHHGPSSLAQQSAYDPRITAYTNWGFDGDTGISGNAWRILSPNVDPLSFVLPGTHDKLTIYYQQRTANQDSMVVKDGGTTIGTVNTVGASTAFVSVTLDLNGRGSGKTISLERAGLVAQKIEVWGIHAWDSQTAAVDIFNFGRFGTTTSAWAVNQFPWSNLNVIPLLAMDVWFVNETSNDMLTSNNVPVETAMTNLGLTVDACKANGKSCVLVNPAKGQQPNYGDASVQAAYSAGLRALALAKDVPLIDEGAVFGDYVRASTKGWFASGDPIHPSAVANDVRAALGAELILTA